MTKKQLYLQIEAKHSPDFVPAVPLPDAVTGVGYTSTRKMMYSQSETPENMADITNPKVFISYSWSSEDHKENVLKWAQELTARGIKVVLDRWNLREGQNKYAFMESMVTDPEVNHVLCFCDARYAEKSDAKEGGVGTESQIITPQVYAKVNQTKFIPIVCEFDVAGEPSHLHGEGIDREHASHACCSHMQRGSDQEN